MHDQRLSGDSGCRDVGAKASLLDGGAIWASVVVETGFTDGDDSTARGSETHQGVYVGIGAVLLVRMHADRREEMFVSFSQCKDAMQVLQSHRHAKRVRHASVPHRRKNVGKATLKFREIEMAVGIDDGGWHGAYMV
jgi:hypothetical protein